jgi:hypothetical protein
LKAKRGEIDQFIDLMVAKREYVDEKCWEEALKLAKLIAESASTAGEREVGVPKVDYLKLPLLSHDLSTKDYVSEKRILVENLSASRQISKCFIISNNTVQTDSYLGECVVFINGTLKTRNQVSNCMIYCDGDVELSSYVSDSIIVTTGEVKLNNQITGSIVQAKGIRSREGYSENNSYINLDRIDVGRSAGDKVRKESGPLGLLKLFDLAQTGIVAEKAKDGVRIAKVLKGNLFDREKFKEGDIFVAIDAMKIRSTEDLIKQLRKKAAGETSAVEVQRGDTVITITVKH